MNFVESYKLRKQFADDINKATGLEISPKQVRISKKNGEVYQSVRGLTKEEGDLVLQYIQDLAKQKGWTHSEMSQDEFYDTSNILWGRVKVH
jgi:hypothetical protein